MAQHEIVFNQSRRAQSRDHRRNLAKSYSETINMNNHRFTIAFTLIVVGIATFSFGVSSRAETASPSLAPFEFDREGATRPEDAATAMFHGSAGESPRHFVRHLLLGVCDGPIATLRKFAESLHRTKFSHGEASFTVYDLPNRIDAKRPIRVIASDAFDSSDKQVAALQFQMASTYYGETFMTVDVAGEAYDGREYQTRIVVAQVGDRWFAIPRCRSSKSFYEIADAMRLSPPAAMEAK